MKVVINSEASDIPFSGISHYIQGFSSSMDMPFLLMKPEVSFFDRIPVIRKIRRNMWWSKRMKEQSCIYHIPHNFGYLPEKLPSVVTIHDLIPLDTTTGWRKMRYSQQVSRTAKQVNVIITASEFAKRDIAKRLNVPEEKIAVIYHGLDPEYEKLPTESDFVRLKRYGIEEPYYLTNGRDRRKNAQVVIESFIALKEKSGLPGKLVVLGSQLRRNKYPEHPDVLFTGFVETEDMPLLYFFAKKFYFLSSFEGFGLPIIESLAMKTPTVVSDQSCLPEIAGGYAKVIPVERKQVMAAMLEGTESISAEDLENGREYARSFSWEKSAKAHEKIYEMAGKY